MFGRNSCTLRPKREEKEEKKNREGQSKESEIRRGTESADKTGALDTGTVNKCAIKTNSLPSQSPPRPPPNST